MNIKDRVIVWVIAQFVSALSRDAVYDVQHECLSALGEA